MTPTFQPQNAVRLPWVGAALLFASFAAWAETPASRPLWEVGSVALGVSQQAYPGSDQNVERVLVVPYFLYRGKVLRADGENFGVRALKTPTFEVGVGFAGAFGSNSDSIVARQGMPNLGTLIEFGPRLKWNLGQASGGGAWRAEFPLRAVFDLSDSAAHRGWSFEPELVYARRAHGGWRYNASVGALVADTSLATTFYQVNPSQAVQGRPAYSAQSGLVSWRLATSISRSLTPDWRLFGFARLDSVAGSANERSPLVRQTTGSTLGLGVSYTWMRSNERADD
jgi:MipA family protein